MISKSQDFKQEYCCTVIRIGEVTPIEDSDFLGLVMVEGRTIVVRKDQVKEGDTMFYVSNECQVNSNFLSINSFFEERTMNADQEKKGYINKYGRIRMVKLRGVLSMGILFGLPEIANWCPQMQEFPMENHIGEDFDTICGHLFVKAYLPMRKEHRPKRTSKVRQHKRFDRTIPGEFILHYETLQLNREIDRLKLDNEVSISVKLHGTSLVIGNILTLKPRWDGLYSRIFVHLPKFLQYTRNSYDIVYSSRTVVKNKYYNDKVYPGYYETDVWGEYYELLKSYIPEGYTIYGEIVGHVGGLSQMIQKGYDYGCKEGTNKLMIYRVSVTENGRHRELNIPEVQKFIEELRARMQTYPEIKNKQSADTFSDRLMDIPLLYHGHIGDLYPEILESEHWHTDLLERLKSDMSRLGMECNEPLCRNKVPREGICLRIMNDPVSECFKLKTLSFLGKEAEMIDGGEIDMEMNEGL